MCGGVRYNRGIANETTKDAYERKLGNLEKERERIRDSELTFYKKMVEDLTSASMQLQQQNAKKRRNQ